MDDNINKILNKGIENLNSVELIDLNKKLLKSSLGDCVDPLEKWATANFSDKNVTAQGENISKKSLLILNGNRKIRYTP